MEVPSKKMEEIYAIPVKYIESWLELKESKGFVEYWVVLKTHYMFLFKDQNTHCKDQYVGYLNIEVGETKCTSKKKTDFLVEISKKKKFHFRAKHDVLQKRWIYALELVTKAEAPGPLPGDPDFKPPRTITPSPNKMKPRRAHSVAVMNYDPSAYSPAVSKSPDSQLQGNAAVAKRPARLSLQLTRQLTIDETEPEKYDEVFIPPSWFFDNLSRNEAIRLLDDQRIGTYLLRNTESIKSPDHYTLSIKDIERIKHHKINPLPDGCYFEGAPNAPFHNPLEAISYLMKSKYHVLCPQPMQGPEVRLSGDGQEDETDSLNESTSSFKRESNEYQTSPVSTSPRGFLPTPPPILAASPPISPTPFLPSPPRLPLPRQMSVPCVQDRFIPPRPDQSNSTRMLTQTLPARSTMRDRPLPPPPVYENAAAIRKHTGLKEDSYVDMQGGFSNSDDEDVPPPLPRKKSWDRIMQENKYVNVPLAENEPKIEKEADDYYERPIVSIEQMRQQRRASLKSV